jgi:G:T-mismatch repair DNA endonuclease (very short patch repair protein)
MDKVISRYQSGEDSPSIARSLGVSATFIARRLNSAGVTMRPNFSHLLLNNPTKGKGHTPEAKEKIRTARKRQFGTPENESRQMSEWAIARIIEGRTGKAYNKLEKAFAALLDSTNIEYTQQYRLGRFIFDFYLPKSNMLIEVHGTFWHADPRFYDKSKLYPAQIKNLLNDERKRLRALRDGFRYTAFWESDIYQSAATIVDSLAPNRL